MEEADGRSLARNLEEVLKYQLSNIQKTYPEVYVDNELTTLEDALNRCVRECTVYMPDYVLNDKGIVEQVRFDKIDL